MYRFLIFSILTLLSLSIRGQTPVNGEKYNGVYILETVIVDGDTIPVVTLRPTTVSANRKARSKRYKRKRSKLYRNVIKTYPYAKVAGTLIKEYNRNLSQLDTESAREAYLDKCEEDLKAEFEDDLTHMTMSQGRVLIKLIDRETGNTSYELIKDLKSGFTAFMWQGVAKLFGSDLKASYNPDNDETDYIIEEVVQKIESGEIPVETRDIQTREAREILEAKNKRLQRRIERERRKQERKK